MQPNIGRWLRNTIALPVCADHPNPGESTFAWKKNSGRLRTVRNACAGRAPRSMRAIRRSLHSAVVSRGAEPSHRISLAATLTGDIVVLHRHVLALDVAGFAEA